MADPPPVEKDTSDEPALVEEQPNLLADDDSMEVVTETSGDEDDESYVPGEESDDMLYSSEDGELYVPEDMDPDSELSGLQAEIAEEERRARGGWTDETAEAFRRELQQEWILRHSQGQLQQRPGISSAVSGRVSVVVESGEAPQPILAVPEFSATADVDEIRVSEDILNHPIMASGYSMHADMAGTIFLDVNLESSERLVVAAADNARVLGGESHLSQNTARVNQVLDMTGPKILEPKFIRQKNAIGNGTADSRIPENTAENVNIMHSGYVQTNMVYADNMEPPQEDTEVPDYGVADLRNPETVAGNVAKKLSGYRHAVMVHADIMESHQEGPTFCGTPHIAQAAQAIPARPMIAVSADEAALMDFYAAQPLQTHPAPVPEEFAAQLLVAHSSVNGQAQPDSHPGTDTSNFIPSSANTQNPTGHIHKPISPLNTSSPSVHVGPVNETQPTASNNLNPAHHRKPTAGAVKLTKKSGPKIRPNPYPAHSRFIEKIKPNTRGKNLPKTILPSAHQSDSQPKSNTRLLPSPPPEKSLPPVAQPPPKNLTRQPKPTLPTNPKPNQRPPPTQQHSADVAEITSALFQRPTDTVQTITRNTRHGLGFSGEMTKTEFPPLSQNVPATVSKDDIMMDSQELENDTDMTEQLLESRTQTNIKQK